jgi:hypothetical protein
VDWAHNAPPEEVVDGFPINNEDYVDNGTVMDVSGKLGHFLDFELRHCPGLQTHNAVMDSFLGNPLVEPHLPAYYLPPLRRGYKC